MRPARAGESLQLSVNRVGPPHLVGAMIEVDPVYLSGDSAEPDRVVPLQGLRRYAEPADAVAFVAPSFVHLLRPGPVKLFATYGRDGEVPIRSNTVDLEVGQGPGSAAPVALWLGRSGCQGCPVYALWVCEDGAVEYRGIANVKVEGRQTGHLTAAQLNQVMAEFERAHFGAMRSEGAPALDLPSTVLVQRSHGVAHGVEFFLGPAPLKQLAAALERAVEVERWIGTQAERDALPRPDSDALKAILGGDDDAAISESLGDALKAPAAPVKKPKANRAGSRR